MEFLQKVYVVDVQEDTMSVFIHIGLFVCTVAKAHLPSAAVSHIAIVHRRPTSDNETSEELCRYERVEHEYVHNNHIFLSLADVAEFVSQLNAEEAFNWRLAIAEVLKNCSNKIKRKNQWT